MLERPLRLRLPSKAAAAVNAAVTVTTGSVVVGATAGTTAAAALTPFCSVLLSLIDSLANQGDSPRLSHDFLPKEVSWCEQQRLLVLFIDRLPLLLAPNQSGGDRGPVGDRQHQPSKSGRHKLTVNPQCVPL